MDIRQQGNQMKVITKQQLNEGIASGKIDIRPTNYAIINDNVYSLQVEEYEDKVTLEKVEEFEDERSISKVTK